MSVFDTEYTGCTVNRPRPGLTVVAITGELEACSAPQLESKILTQLDPSCPTLVFDLSGVQFIDSTGIRMLLQVASERQGGDRPIVVCPRSHGPRRALEIVGLGRMMRMVERLEEALPGGGSGSSA